MQKLFEWLDDNILKIGVGFLLFFIPLWPKLPLVGVARTWVYIRLEDVFLALVVAIWILQLFRRKVSLRTPLSMPIFVYWLVGGISLIFSLVFLASHIPNFFPHVAFLHWLRRIEYIIVFFIAFSTIKNVKDIYYYLVILSVTILGVIAYGLGQKFLGFPAFLTMNEEFAKGIPLHLPAGARITSTFAGHYDLAAYLVLMIAITGSLIFGIKKNLFRLFFFLLTLASVVLLLMTASRVSFVVYLLTISTMLWWQKKRIMIIPVILASIIVLNFVSGTSERFAKTFRVSQVVYDVETGRPIAAVSSIEEGKIITEKDKSPAEENLPTGSGFISLPVSEPTTTSISVITRQNLATTSGEVATVSGRFLIQKALIYDISFTTRFQGEWPRAMEAFNRNIFLGSGYSSIALATDNDYVRMLGETGLAGLLSFIFLFTSLAIFLKFSLAKVTHPLTRALAIGVAAGLTGLLVNAVLIDVFEASKVALSFWLILGITLGGLKLFYKDKIPLFAEIKKIILHPVFPVIILFIAVFALFWGSLSNYFVGDDFTWLKWATKGVFSQIPSYFTSAEGFFYRPIQKIIYMAAYTIFWLMPGGYHFLSLLIHFGVTTGLYGFVSKVSKSRKLAVIAAFIFLVMSVHGESIFWISTIGHTVSTMFIIWGLYFYAIFRSANKKIFFLLSFILLILACLSYEGGIVGPLLIIWFEITLGKRKLLPQLAVLAIVPGYLFLRTWAGSHGLAGDYNYNLKLLPINVLGNLFGYLGLIFVGPNFISFYDSLREWARHFKELALVGSAGIFLLVFLITVSLREKIKTSPSLIFYIGFVPLSLLPFLGLGNITERYAYLASVAVAALIGLMVLKISGIISRKSGLVATLVMFALTLGIFTYYLNDINRSQADWKEAGNISYKMLIALRKNYLNRTKNKTFYFVNVPIRTGRAWVFPVGLPDALWHTFRDESTKVSIVKSLDEALNLKTSNPDSLVIVFEKGEIEEVIKETKEIPIIKDSKK